MPNLSRKNSGSVEEFTSTNFNSQNVIAITIWWNLCQADKLPIASSLSIKFSVVIAVGKYARKQRERECGWVKNLIDAQVISMYMEITYASIKLRARKSFDYLSTSLIMLLSLNVVLILDQARFVALHGTNFWYSRHRSRNIDTNVMIDESKNILSAKRPGPVCFYLLGCGRCPLVTKYV